MWSLFLAFLFDSLLKFKLASQFHPIDFSDPKCCSKCYGSDTTYTPYSYMLLPDCIQFMVYSMIYFHKRKVTITQLKNTTEII